MKSAQTHVQSSVNVMRLLKALYWTRIDTCICCKRQNERMEKKQNERKLFAGFDMVYLWWEKAFCCHWHHICSYSIYRTHTHTCTHLHTHTPQRHYPILSGSLHLSLTFLCFHHTFSLTNLSGSVAVINFPLHLSQLHLSVFFAASLTLSTLLLPFNLCQLT